MIAADGAFFDGQQAVATFREHAFERIGDDAAPGDEGGGLSRNCRDFCGLLPRTVIDREGGNAAKACAWQAA
ncbi:hypothetical protein MMF98_04055 [Variovorax sp. CYS-02]|uniref:Uncharacterized protein n=1 Tax=Variovorax terrae TaxID=2923278 RepID=A0A9X1VV15_9BURK|nr:hypothetical protein [Variovorax terrae]MCJ0762377.1 hypothetical protein [Variovorax terrae]